jgi:hypothetical protein
MGKSKNVCSGSGSGSTPTTTSIIKKGVRALARPNSRYLVCFFELLEYHTLVGGSKCEIDIVLQDALYRMSKTFCSEYLGVLQVLKEVQSFLFLSDTSEKPVHDLALIPTLHSL